MNEYAIATTAEAMLAAGEITPIIIVAFGTDSRFGINSADTVSTYETSSGKRSRCGRYSDFIITELIPYIDNHYATVAAKEGRFIGGYSMGGFAALHNAFLHPSMFAKAGGHSPSLFIEDFPDRTVSDWLYPTAKIRRMRDPIHLAQHVDLTSLSVFLDVETGGSTGVQRLYEVLLAHDVDATYEVLSLSHSRASCAENMREYLAFYAGIGAR